MFTLSFVLRVRANFTFHVLPLVLGPKLFITPLPKILLHIDIIAIRGS
jgi:hypothetical protein